MTLEHKQYGAARKKGSVFAYRKFTSPLLKDS